MNIGNYDKDIYRLALEAFLANEKERAAALAKQSATPEAENLLRRLTPQPPATPEQVEGYGEAFDAFEQGDEDAAMRLSDAIKSMPEAARLRSRVKNKQGAQ